MVPAFDEDGYPTEESLNHIAKFDILNGRAFLSFSERCFSKYYGSWKELKDSPYSNPEINCGKPFQALRIATGGWSGNESVVSAMESNPIWGLLWKASFSGGLYILELREGFLDIVSDSNKKH